MAVVDLPIVVSTCKEKNTTTVKADNPFLVGMVLWMVHFDFKNKLFLACNLPSRLPHALCLTKNVVFTPRYPFSKEFHAERKGKISGQKT